MFNITQKSLPSVYQHSFSHVPMARIPRSQFKRNVRHPLTFCADYIVPVYFDEILPADTVKMDWSWIARLLTPEVPFMDNLYIDWFAFFCPTRLLQSNWQKLMGEQDDPGDSIDFSTPKLTSPASTGYTVPTDWSSPTTAQLSGALMDYLGIPPGIDSFEHHNYGGRMYNLVYNEWFRDQNLQDSVVVDVDDGPDTYTDYILLKRGKRHDYFTSCLPWLQKGTAESLAIGSTAPVYGTGKSLALTDGSKVGGTTTYGAYYTTGLENNEDVAYGTAVSGTSTFATNKVIGVPTEADLSPTTDSGLVADLSSATGVSIGALYQSFAIQDLLQTDARGGTRYTEILNAHFGVTSPDFRLQRPEYLGGGSFPFMVSPLAQTSETGTTELGTLGATVAAAGSNFSFVKSFVEHGYIMVMINVRADLTYQQGVARHFSRDTRYDFYFPALANLGEQAVLNKEIFAQGAAGGTDDDGVFGYQERWAEYRYGHSYMSDRMRSDHATSLDVWHLSEDFASLPSLNAAFIQGNTPITRVSSVTTEPHFIGDFYGRGLWTRPLPMYSVPGLVNRF